MLLAFCGNVQAQEVIVQDTIADIVDSTALDSVAQEVDTTYAEEAEEESTTSSNIEQQLRNKELPHSLWDDQTPGEWNDAAQGRFYRQAVPADKMKELRDMKALQYYEKARTGKTWWITLGAWVAQRFVFFRNLFYILLGALLLAGIILFIRKNDILLFRRSHQQTATAEALTEQGPQNYDALARAAIAAGNWREAVRMRYLHTLQLLEAKQLIAPGKDKTNMDYLRELSSTTWHKPFAKLTLHYEYIWYGQQPLNDGQFSQLEDQFSAFKKSLR
jgi:hypothetical protein